MADTTKIKHQNRMKSRPMEQGCYKHLIESLFGHQADEHLAVHSACATDIGERKENQDLCHRDDRNAVYLVVDGMGGHQGGALASQIAIETIPDEIVSSMDSGEFDSAKVEQCLQRGLQRAYHEMEFVASKCPDYRKMGCTMAIAAVINDRLFYTHLGDARIYLYHKGKVEQLTKDESLVQELIDAGAVPSDAARTHRWRHVVTNCLTATGMRKTPHWKELKLSAGDEILLTSDGLTDVVPDCVIEKRLRENATPETSVRSLITEALDRHTHDNVSCVVAKFQPASQCASVTKVPVCSPDSVTTCETA